MQTVTTRSLATAALVALALAPAGVPAAKTYKAKVGGGPTGGTFNTFAHAMAVHVPRHLDHVEISAVGSGGSVENLARIDAGDFDFGLCHAVDAALARAGRLPGDDATYDDVRALGFLYGAPAQLVVREDGGIAVAADLAGARVAVGNAGSGAATSAERFFGHLGIWDAIEPQFIGYSVAAAAFQADEIDAFWVLAGFPNRSIVTASRQTGIALIDLDADARESGFYAAFAYLPTEIPAGTYGEDMPACATFQDATLLCAHDGVPADVVYDVLRTLWSEQGRRAMVEAKRTFRTMTLDNGFDGAAIPLHPGAVRFWEEQGRTVPEHLR